MKRTSLTIALAVAPVLAALPAGVASAAADPAGVTVGGITYTVPVSTNALSGQCTIVADRWTADYGPTHVYATAVSPAGAIWTRLRCTVTKNGTTYVEQEATDSGAYVLINAGDGTIPVAGIQVCAAVERQLTIDSRPFARRCDNF
jgi:hypothetical protein